MGAPARAGGADSGGYPLDQAPPWPPPRLEIEPGPCELPAEDAREIYLGLWAAWGNGRLCLAFYREQRQFPADLWRRAIQELLCNGGPAPRSIKLIKLKVGDIQDWKPDERKKADARLSRVFRGPEPAAPVMQNHNPLRVTPPAPATPEDIAEARRMAGSADPMTRRIGETALTLARRGPGGLPNE